MKYKGVKDLEDNQIFVMTFCGIVRLGHKIDDKKKQGYKTIGEIEAREYSTEKYNKCWVQLMEK